MTKKPSADERIAKLTISQIYPLYVDKVTKKGRAEADLLRVIEWLTGFDEKALQVQIAKEATFEEFFAEATLNPNASLIKGVICGHRVEDIENPLTQKCRYLDKVVDELARGKKIESILRS